MNKAKFLDLYFKFLILTFWPIIWFKWQLFPTLTTSLILFLIYTVLVLIYIAMFLHYEFSFKASPKVVIAYKISMIVAFVFTIVSFLLFPTNGTFLFLKIMFALILLYISYLEVYKYKIEEGVVGILSSLLIIVFALFY